MPVMSQSELQRRRLDILRKARECFARYGYEGATVRRLEEATGKSRGAIFHHFGDKENLFFEIARHDAAQQADIVAKDGLVEVMRDMVRNPDRHPWLRTRLEVASIARTDPTFRDRWREQQAVLDEAVRERLRSRESRAGHGSDEQDVDTVQRFLEIFMDGLIARLAAGEGLDGLDAVLDVVEGAVRTRFASADPTRGS